MRSFIWHLDYELVVLKRSRWGAWLAVGLVLVVLGSTVIVGLSIDTYYDFDDRLSWAAMLTQGGLVGWPPLFAFFLALLGILVWSQDCGGESSYVTYATFPDRWRTALTRSAVLTCMSAVISMLTVLLTVVIGVVFFDLGSLAEHAELIGVKTLWAVVCGTAFAHLGAALCALSRSALVATGLLLMLPWIVEPVLIELCNLASGLDWLGPWLRFLPFRVAGDVLGSPDFEAGGWSVGGQLQPAGAAAVALAYATVSALVVQWRYCHSDAS